MVVPTVMIEPKVTGVLLRSNCTPRPEATPELPAEVSASTPVALLLSAVPSSASFTGVPVLQFSEML
ncbi:hypothetical protein D3C78_1902330 [compost metagenome]